VGEAANELVPQRRQRERVAQRQALDKHHLERQVAEVAR
jgi:hypothetical protein